MNPLDQNSSSQYSPRIERSFKNPFSCLKAHQVATEIQGRVANPTEEKHFFSLGIKSKSSDKTHSYFSRAKKYAFSLLPDITTSRKVHVISLENPTENPVKEDILTPTENPTPVSFLAETEESPSEKKTKKIEEIKVNLSLLNMNRKYLPTPSSLPSLETLQREIEDLEIPPAPSAAKYIETLQKKHTEIIEMQNEVGKAKELLAKEEKGSLPAEILSCKIAALSLQIAFGLEELLDDLELLETAILLKEEEIDISDATPLDKARKEILEKQTPLQISDLYLISSKTTELQNSVISQLKSRYLQWVEELAPPSKKVVNPHKIRIAPEPPAFDESISGMRRIAKKNSSVLEERFSKEYTNIFRKISKLNAEEQIKFIPEENESNKNNFISISSETLSGSLEELASPNFDIVRMLDRFYTYSKELQ